MAGDIGSLVGVTDCGERAAVAAPAMAATTDAQIDGYKLRRVPEAGINGDHVPGPPPVVFPDLVLRQSVVVPALAAVGL